MCYTYVMRDLICQNCNSPFQAGKGNFKFCPECRKGRAKRYKFLYARRPSLYDICPVCGGRKGVASQKCNTCWAKTRKREGHPRWQGGRNFSRRDGYITILLPSGKRMLEHRFVLEEKMGRPLKPSEIGHHLNGVRDDNRPENLVAIPRSFHPSNTFVEALQARIRQLEQLHLPI